MNEILTKVCFKCNEKKQIIEFYKHPQMSLGVVNKCKVCNKLDVKNDYYRKSSDSLWVEKEKERCKEKYYRLNYKEKQKIWDENKPWKKEAILKNLNKKLKIEKGFECHHWSYNTEHFEDVFTVSEDNLLYELGDSNGDDSVNIADIINTVDFMLGTQLSRFIEYATDVNDDNVINVLDLMGIVDIILNPKTTTTNNSVSSTNKNGSRKRSVDQIDYRSSKAVGDVYLYWVNESLYMDSEHKVGGLQMSINNDAEVLFSEDLSVLNKTKIQKEGTYEMLMYSIDATPLDNTSEILRFYGNQDEIDLNSIIVSTTDGGKLNVIVRTLSVDDLIDLDSFRILETYPNPVTDDILNIEYFTPTTLKNQTISMVKNTSESKSYRDVLSPNASSTHVLPKTSSSDEWETLPADEEFIKVSKKSSSKKNLTVIHTLEEFIGCIKEKKKPNVDFIIHDTAHCSHTFEGTLCKDVRRCKKIHIQRCIAGEKCKNKSCPFLHKFDMPSNESKQSFNDSMELYNKIKPKKQVKSTK